MKTTNIQMIHKQTALSRVILSTNIYIAKYPKPQQIQHFSSVQNCDTSHLKIFVWILYRAEWSIYSKMNTIFHNCSIWMWFEPHFGNTDWLTTHSMTHYCFPICSCYFIISRTNVFHYKYVPNRKPITVATSYEFVALQNSNTSNCAQPIVTQTSECIRCYR